MEEHLPSMHIVLGLIFILCRLGMVAHSWNLNTGKVRQEVKKVILGYMTNSSPTWATWDLVSKENKNLVSC